MTALYKDANLTLDEDGITIHRYYFPFATAKRVAYGNIQGIRRGQLNWSSGTGRFWGAGDPRYWYPLDIHRGRKPLLLVLDVGRRVKPCITPEDPDRVIALLKARVKA